jgi:MFS family permease
MTPSLALAAVNFFMADVGGGIGPYLSVWLQGHDGFGAERVGTVLTVGSIAGALCAAPAGRLVDWLGRPRLVLALACALIVGGTLALIPAHAFWAVALAQAVVSAGGALGGPSITGLALALVGKARFPQQQGANEAANHAGNVASNLLIAALATLIGISSAFAVLAATAAATVFVLLLIPARAVDAARMRGREKAVERSGATPSLLRNRRFLRLLAGTSMFHLGNVAILPMLMLRIKDLGGQDPTEWVSFSVVVLYLAMIPVAYLGGRAAARFGCRPVLIASCAVLPVRALLCVFATDVSWLIPIEILDGLGAGLISVASAPAVADCTYGSGRTQTAMGAMQAVQSAAAAVSTFVAGAVALHLGWQAMFAMLAVFPLIGLALLSRHDLPAASAPVHLPVALTRAAV